jgi:hypothetical protein
MMLVSVMDQVRDRFDFMHLNTVTCSPRMEQAAAVWCQLQEVDRLTVLNIVDNEVRAHRQAHVDC